MQRADGALIAAPAWRPGSVAGQHVTGFLGDFAARVRSPSGAAGLVMSSTPLRSTLATGSERPVDLTVRDTGSAFEPVNPSVSTVVPKRSDGEFRVGDMRLRFAGVQPSAGRLVRGKVLYPNTGPDSDTAVVVVPEGLETFTILRSPHSPSDIPFALSLPAGDALMSSTTEPGALDVARAGSTIARVTAPSAADDQGRPVAVSLRQTADGFSVQVDHRDRDVAYPVTVDPVVWEVPYQFYSGPRTNSAGWGFFNSNPGSWATVRPEQGQGSWGWGLYTYQFGTGNYPNAPYENGEWNYYGEFWRNSTAYVYATEMWTSFSPGYGTCRYTGIYSLADGWEAGYPASYNCTSGNQYGVYEEWCAHGNCDPNASPAKPPNYAVFGTQAWASNAANFANDLYDANVYISDRDAPTVAASGAPSTWIQNDASFSATAHDSGVGVNELSVSSPQAAGWGNSWSSGCSIDPTNHCPADSPVLPLSTAGLPDGIDNINATASDVIGAAAPGHQVSATVATVKLDRTAPIVGTSGELDQAQDEPRVTTDSADLFVHADDENDAGTATSGVQSIKVQIDGADPSTTHPYATSNVVTQPGPCDSCSLENNFQFDLSSFGDGSHTVDVYATDFAGNQTHQTWTVSIDRTSPKPSCSDPSSDPSGCQPDPPSTTPPSCTSPVPGIGAPGGTFATSAQAVAETQQYFPSALTTSDSTVINSLTVAPAVSPGLLGSSYQSSATMTASTIDGTSPTYTVGSGTGAVCIAPTAVSGGALPPQVLNGAALEYADTAPSTDTILRPTPFGVQDISQLRDSNAPETQSYQVALGTGQYLQQLDSGSIAIIDPSLPTISSSYPPIDDGTDDTSGDNAPNDYVPGSATASPNPTAFTPDDLAGLTPDDADIPPSSTQYQYESENRWLNYADQDADGQDVAIIAPPAAVDANGTSVPTSIAITGPNTFSITTSHREGTYAYPVYTSQKTTGRDAKYHKRPNYGLAAQQGAGLLARDKNGEGSPKVRHSLHIPSRTTASFQNPPTARLVLFHQDACDPWDSGPSPTDILTVPAPPAGSANYSNWQHCHAAARFVQIARAKNLAPYITLEPDTRNPQSLGPGAYASSVARLWHYSQFQYVKVWGATNEPDLQPANTDGTAAGPPKVAAVQAARIWRAVNSRALAHDGGCGKCIIVAGEFNGDTKRSNYPYYQNDSYIQQYMSFLNSKRSNPHVWAMHDYYDVIFNDTNRFGPPKPVKPSKQYSNVRMFASNVRGFGRGRDRVWLSEQGVELTGQGHSLATNGGGVQRNAAKGFLRLELQDSIVDLANYYQFFGTTGGFDSALVRNPPVPPKDGTPLPYTFGGFRSAYCVFTHEPNGNCFQGTGL